MASDASPPPPGAWPVTPTPSGRLDISDDARLARDALLRKVSAEADLPTLGSSVARVVQLASSDDDSVRALAHFLLSDVALTQKVLRLANTVAYRSAGGGAVTTISRAIFLLGFDTVKTSALAMLLVEGMKGKHAQSVRTELDFALGASVIGRELARRSHFKDAEEAAVAALFKNMGRLLVAAHDHRLYEDIARLSDAGSHTPAQASMHVLGCSFEMLAESVLHEWQIPETIIHALAPLPSGTLRAPRSRQEWLQQVAAFSTTAAALIPKMTQPGEDVASRALLARFGAALNLDAAKLAELMATVARETRALHENSDLLFGADGLDAEAPDADEEMDSGLPAGLLMQTAEEAGTTIDMTACHPSGKPLQAREMLLAGVQDVTQMMASGRLRVNDLILLALETLYRSMGFRFATICLRDVATGQYRARIALGDDHARLQKGFSFTAGGKRDLFSLAMQNDADLLIADASEPKIAALIPAWHHALMPDVRSFIVVPLVVQKAPFGFFYADRTRPAPEGVPPDETALIKTLKGQVLAALGAR